MFTFTTTNVINSKSWFDGQSRWTFGKTAEDTNDTFSDKTTFAVKGVGTFHTKNVIGAYKANYVAPDFAKVQMGFDSTPAEEGDIFRLSIYVGLTQASQDSYYANDLYYKGKPFTVEFVYKSDWETTVKKLAKTIQKLSLMTYGDKLLNVSCEGSDLILKATNEYQRFLKVNIEKLDEAAHFGMGDFYPVKTLEDLSEVTTESEAVGSNSYFKGQEGFGTYSWILHNLRLPTCARTYAFAPNQDEAPVLGAKYTQFTIRYCANRGPLGLNAVGDQTKSVTTHVFFVSDACSDDFERDLGDFVSQANQKLETVLYEEESVTLTTVPPEDPTGKDTSDNSGSGN